MGSGLRILLVDDAAVLRSLFARIVTALGHHLVASESSVRGALERASALTPDVLVVDGRLEGEDIGAGVGELRAELPAAQILIVASLEETALVAVGRAAGATGVVRRPLSRRQIHDALEGAAPVGRPDP